MTSTRIERSMTCLQEERSYSPSPPPPPPDPPPSSSSISLTRGLRPSIHRWWNACSHGPCCLGAIEGVSYLVLPLGAGSLLPRVSDIGNTGRLEHIMLATLKDSIFTRARAESIRLAASHHRGRTTQSVPVHHRLSTDSVPVR